jgi:hypothetical protein
VNPYRLVALVIIALFALGYARLLIDTGIRDEDPPPDAELDLLTKAACMAIAEPLAEVVDAAWTQETHLEGPAEVPACDLSASRPATLSEDEAHHRIAAVFELTNWRQASSTSGATQIFVRDPVECTATVDALIHLRCLNRDLLP